MFEFFHERIIYFVNFSVQNVYIIKISTIYVDELQKLLCSATSTSKFKLRRDSSNFNNSRENNCGLRESFL